MLCRTLRACHPGARVLNRIRLGAPLAALACLTLCALMLAAEFGFAFCRRRIEIPICGMSGAPETMTMPGGGLMICPIVLCLVVASALLAAAALVALASDPYRRVTRRLTLRALATLPVGRTAGYLALAAMLVGVAMLALDTEATAKSALALAGIAGAGSLAAAALAHALGRVVLALCERLWPVILAAIGRLSVDRPFVLPRHRRAPLRVPLLVSSRTHGLRAPPTLR